MILQSATQKWRRLAKGKINNNNNKHNYDYFMTKCSMVHEKSELINTTCNAFNNLTVWRCQLGYTHHVVYLNPYIVTSFIIG